MPRYLTEFLGTLALTLLIALSGHPMAVGLGLAGLIYMGGHISGALYNPAVTLAMRLTGDVDRRDFVPFLLAQCGGGLAGAFIGAACARGAIDAPELGRHVVHVQALAVEIVFTALMVLVIFNVACHPRSKGNSYFGVAIGMTVIAGAMAGGPISGAAFNPAAGVGLVLVKTLVAGGAWAHAWIYIVGPVIGALAAAAIFRQQLRA